METHQSTTARTARDVNTSTNYAVTGEQVDQAVAQAVREAVADHLKNGRSVPFEKDGKVVWQHPDGSVRDTP